MTGFATPKRSLSVDIGRSVSEPRGTDRQVEPISFGWRGGAQKAMGRRTAEGPVSFDRPFEEIGKPGAGYFRSKVALPTGIPSIKISTW